MFVVFGCFGLFACFVFGLLMFVVSINIVF